MKHPVNVILEVREKMRQLAETAGKSTGRGHKIKVRLSARGRTKEDGGHSRLEDTHKSEKELRVS
jgi:hypothetical protein